MDTELFDRIDALESAVLALASRLALADGGAEFIESIGVRESDYSDLGYGNFDEERGWRIAGVFVSAEPYLSRP